MSRKTGKPLKKELRDYQEAGVTLWLDGHPSTPKKIVKAHKLAENGVYMRPQFLLAEKQYNCKGNPLSLGSNVLTIRVN